MTRTTGGRQAAAALTLLAMVEGDEVGFTVRSRRTQGMSDAPGPGRRPRLA